MNRKFNGRLKKTNQISYLFFTISHARPQINLAHTSFLLIWGKNKMIFWHLFCFYFFKDNN